MVMTKTIEPSEWNSGTSTESSGTQENAGVFNIELLYGLVSSNSH